MSQDDLKSSLVIDRDDVTRHMSKAKKLVSNMKEELLTAGGAERARLEVEIEDTEQEIKNDELRLDELERQIAELPDVAPPDAQPALAPQQAIPAGLSEQPRIINNFNVVPVSVLQSRVVAVRPTLDAEGAAQAILAWGKDLKIQWPADVTAATIADKLDLIYVPYLVTSGVATATVTASVGKTKIFSELTPTERADRCSFCNGTGINSSGGKCIHCDGRGYRGQSIYAWSEHTNAVSATVNNSVTPNYAATKMEIDVQGRSAKGVEIRPPFPQDMLILEPEVNSDEALRSQAERRLRDALLAEFKTVQENTIADSVRNVRMSEMSVQQVEVHSWLLPIYVGSFGSVDLVVDGDMGTVNSSRRAGADLQVAEGTTLDAAVAQGQMKVEKIERRVAGCQGILGILALLGVVGVIVYILFMALR